jgi:hypothetical protein
VDQQRQVLVVVHPLDLHAAAAGNRNIHVLSRRPGAAPHLSRGPRNRSQQPATGLQLPRREQVGLGDHLGERHPQPVGLERDAVADVGHLAAGVLLQRELADAQLAVHAQLRHPERHRAREPHHGRALKAGGDRAVEVLLAHHVQLGHQVQVAELRDLDGTAHRLLVGAHRAPLQAVHDLLLRLELHERGAVVLTQLAQGGAHVAQHLGVVAGDAPARGAAAEQLGGGAELLVDF